MPHFSCSEVLTEAAGVKIVTSLPEEDVLDMNSRPPGMIVLKMQKVKATSNVHGKSCGFHLTKSKWDPYPWVGYVENNSPADLAGLRAGDCLLGVDDADLLGLKIKDIANLIRGEEGVRDINFSVWRYTYQKEERNDTGLALKGPLPDVAKNLANALSGTIRALECPICLESAAPPVSQCVHGHILCVVCRPKTTRCPVCRVRLGQGRCLLADNIRRIFRDVFNVNNNETVDKTLIPSEHCSLREQLFGKDNKKQESPVVSRSKSNSTMLKPRQFLLTRLLFGDREKATSADNLIRVSEMPGGVTAILNRATDTNGSRVRLSMNDRTKSASTGELSRDNEAPKLDNSSLQITELSAMNASRQSLSLPQTPTWGGSTDSVSCVQLTCPLLQSCREVVTYDSLLEHIKTHAIPQVHFYSGNVKLSLPLPFGHDAFYIFHHGANMFFFQCGEETAWMTYPVKVAYANTWEWTLHAWDDNGTEVRIQRHVASLEDPVSLSSQHIVPLPNALLLKSINVQISEPRSHDRLYV